MAFQKADIGCRLEAQYTYYDGCFLCAFATVPTWQALHRAAYRPLAPGKLAGSGLCDQLQGDEPPGVRRGQRSVALMVDIPLIRRDPHRRLCHYSLTLIPSKRSSGIQSST
jgi:hypothetical protein